MRLCVSAVLLLGLARTWTGADPSPDHGPEDCSKFNAPLSLKDKTPVLGRFHFMAGFTDSPLYKTLLGLSSSFWFNVTDTQTGLRLNQFNKMNGTCVESRANATISGDTATVLMQNITSEFQFISSGSSSMVLDINTTASDISSFVRKLNLDPKDFSTSLKTRSFYLMSREAEVSDTDLQLFRDHARCAGFTGELDYIHQKEHAYCSEEESVLMLF